jgi:hypothetical protein
MEVMVKAGFRRSCLSVKRRSCHSPGFLRRHPGADVVVDMHLQMALELVGKLAFASGFDKQSLQPEQPRAQLSHD